MRWWPRTSASAAPVPWSPRAAISRPPRQRVAASSSPALGKGDHPEALCGETQPRCWNSTGHMELYPRQHTTRTSRLRSAMASSSCGRRRSGRRGSRGPISEDTVFSPGYDHRGCGDFAKPIVFVDVQKGHRACPSMHASQVMRPNVNFSNLFTGVFYATLYTQLQLRRNLPCGTSRPCSALTGAPPPRPCPTKPP